MEFARMWIGLSFEGKFVLLLIAALSLVAILLWRRVWGLLSREESERTALLATGWQR